MDSKSAWKLIEAEVDGLVSADPGHLADTVRMTMGVMILLRARGEVEIVPGITVSHLAARDGHQFKMLTVFCAKRCEDVRGHIDAQLEEAAAEKLHWLDLDDFGAQVRAERIERRLESLKWLRHAVDLAVEIERTTALPAFERYGEWRSLKVVDPDRIETYPEILRAVSQLDEDGEDEDLWSLWHHWMYAVGHDLPELGMLKHEWLKA